VPPFSLSNQLFEGIMTQRHPLLEPAVVAHIFKFVGAGHCLFIAALSKIYKQVYEKLDDQTLKVLNDRDWPQEVVCTAHMTLYRAVFASAACLEWVSSARWAHGLWLSPVCSMPARQRVIERCAGEYADIETLQAARAIRLRFSEDVVLGAARSGSLAKLKYLFNERQRHSELSDWATRRVCELAARSGNVELLQWLKKQGFELT
jgi:hypothetical protein